MRRMTEFILKNWLGLTAGFVLTAICVKVMYGARGHFAIGGEWLIAPFIVFAGCAVRNFAENDLPMWVDIFTQPDDDEEEECW